MNLAQLLAVFRRENRAEYEESEAERAVLAHPKSPVAIRALLDASARERQRQRERDAVLRERLAALTAPTDGAA